MMLKLKLVPLLLALFSSSLFAAQNLNERLENHGLISVGTEGTYKPFTYHDRNGNLTGYDVEVMRAVAEKLGITVEFRETEWSAMLAGLKTERFDLVANQVALTTPQRRATFDLSTPYNYSGAVMVARKDDDSIQSLEDAKGKKSASSLNSNYGELAKKAGAVIVPVDGLAMSLKLLEQHRADLTFNDSLSILDYLKQNPKANLKIVWQASEQRGAGFVVNKGNDKALEKINQALETLRQEGKLKSLAERFFGKNVSIPADASK